MEHIYFWILFIVVCLTFITPAIIAIIQVVDDSDEGAMSYFFTFSVLISGLIPIVGINVLPERALFNSWYIALGILGLVQIIIWIFNLKNSIHYTFSLILTIAIICCILLCNFSLTITKSGLLPNFEWELPMIWMSFWLPLATILVIVALLLRRREINYVNVPSRDKHNIEYLSESQSMEAVLMRRTIENLTQKIAQQYHDLSTNIREISKDFNKLKVQKIVGSKNNTANSDKMFIEMIGKIEKDLAIISNRIYSTDVNQITITNQVLVRELTHFIATPLATIESTCDLIQNVSTSNNNEKLNQYITRIKSAVIICKGILQTYREIFLCSISPEDSSLRNLIKDSFDVYKGGKNISIKVEVNDKYDGISNYYILSTILPVLANAVRASKENSEIEVIELDGVIRITNTYLDDIEIANLEQDGFSTKENHKGMGLFTVRHLLASRKSGILKIYKREDKIVFEIPVCIHNNEENE
ncbi:MAG: hypothetical protein NC453_00460 [Muribaculum sp.]|nr:hypothetical protein [Muribaculum sp.]